MHNLIVCAVAALVPLIVGTAWYSPMLFAKPWMAAVGLTEADRGKRGMAVQMIALYVLGILLAMGLMFASIHQYHLASIVINEPGFKQGSGPAFTDFMMMMDKYGHNFRTYKHGAVHGAIAAFFFALPLIGSCAAFELRGWKYVGITFGYWLINFTLMGAIVCHWCSPTLM